MLADAPPIHAQVIGHSVRHRALRLVRVGAETPGAHAVRVLVVGCVHGTERAGLPVVQALRRATPPAGVQLLLLDAANPDGCARGTRGNARGVDLNRNFPWGWRRQGGIYASGSGPASEPETKAIMSLIRRERPRVTIWFHQHMDLVDRTRGSDPAIIARYARTARMRVRTLPRLPGTATRWQEHVRPSSTAFVVELPAGTLSRAAVRRHVAAVQAVVGAVAGASAPSTTGASTRSAVSPRQPRFAKPGPWLTFASPGMCRRGVRPATSSARPKRSSSPDDADHTGPAACSIASRTSSENSRRTWRSTSKPVQLTTKS
ncbi:MAG TPA: DUF2817 domain-containing protein [Baekduia sp.]|uniref:DUF2817 domain-containing protein n=1 Tax=Baekduia sp. TaxID=2600305 RepID=UPI002D777ED2|nr:DUF2817 domain-containing protein [Baekduia sp.]HET6505895.1 DUF2817 domain-containing protein [Baekduia sp.]